MNEGTGSRQPDAGYLTDVEYTGNYYSFLAPPWLAYIAAINGCSAPRLDGAFTWCELGCGKGITALVLAALHPQGEFHACDFNSAHVSYAERLRSAARIENLRLHAKSFRDLATEALPDFDFIVLHGVYSWVPDAVRGEIREFLRRRLKPGGLAMVSYNAMPGWAHLQPVRRMMQEYAAGVPGDPLERVRAAFAQVRLLARKGAAYFATLPAAAQHLEQMADHDIRYIAHEYLTPHGDPFYFSDVERAMRDAGLAFAGSMAPADNYVELAVASAFHDLMSPALSRSARETYRDFIANTSFRQDLYAAQPRADQPMDPPLARFDGMAFCLTGLPEQLPLARSEGPLQFDLRGQADLVGKVHALLANGPAKAPRIHAAIGPGSETETSFFLQQLVVSGHLAPCAPGRPGHASRLNEVLVDAGIREQWQHVPLACPGTGSATKTELVNAAAIEAMARLDAEEQAARSVLAGLRRHAHPVNWHAPGGERRPATDDEVLGYVAAVARNLRDPASRDGRLLRQLGILS